MADDLLTSLGGRIRKLRKQRGWTQIELAEKVGLDRSFIADVERGKRNISILNLDPKIEYAAVNQQRVPAKLPTSTT